MQSKNKNDSVQLSTRYQQYDFTKRHLRGTPRPEVFPFGDTDQEDTRNPWEDLSYTIDANYHKGTNTLSKSRRQLIHQLNNPTHSNDRVYGTDGVSQTLNTMQGGNKQPFVKIPEATKQGYAEANEGDSINLSVPNSKTRRGRVGKGVAQTLDTGMQQHTLQHGSIRRLTPTECERLQGFPEVEKSVILQVCTENLNNLAYVEDQSRKLQKLAGSVGKEDPQENAVSATELSLTNNQQTNKHVQPDVLINCVENGVEIHSQGKLLLNANGVAKKNWSPQHMEIGDFAQIVAGINTTLEQITKHGEGVSHLSEQCLILPANGRKLVQLCGNEMTQLAEGVENDSTTLKKLLKSTTSDLSDIESLEQRLITLFSYVILAIIGYIPTEIKSQSICTIEIKSKLGWTFGVSDTQRYKTLGNAVTVNVIRDIFERII